MNNKLLSIVFFYFLYSIATPFLYSEATITKKIMQQNLEAFPYEEEDWSSDVFYEFLVHVMKSQANLQEFSKRRAVFLMVDRYYKNNNFPQSTIINDPMTWNDLNLFCGQKNVTYYLADKIDRTSTMFGKIMLYTMLVQPDVDISRLQQRQTVIKELMNNSELFNAIENALQLFKKSENMFISFWTNDPFKQAVQRRYFNYSLTSLTDALNKNTVMLNFKSLFGHQQRCISTIAKTLAAVVLPLYGICYMAQWALPDTIQRLSSNLRSSGGPLFGVLNTLFEQRYVVGALAIGSGMTQGLQVRESADWMSDNFTLDRFIHKKMAHIASITEVLKNITDIIQQNYCLSLFMNNRALSKLFSSEASDEFKSLLSHLSSDTFKKKPSLLINKGRVLVSYRLFCLVKEEFEDALITLGQLDVFMSLVKLYKEHEQLSSRYSFAEFSDSTQPFIDLNQFWNPFIDVEKVVCNSLQLGGVDNHRTIIITGPNAGGKSTLVKGIAIAVLMAQSFGIAPAQSATITPFHKIMTYLNVIDDIGAGNSLFKAQAVRAQSIMDTVKYLPNDQKSLVLVDEMFNGTSPKEAQACAFSVAKELGSYTNNVSIFSTHYVLLTTLGKNLSAFGNYKVTVNKDVDGNLHYPFVLSPGISDQHVALDILRNEGFSGSIIDNAQEKLSATTPV